MKTFIFALLLFFTNFALASIAGNWTGYGNWAFRNEADATHCDSMTMTWSESDTKLNLEKGHYECDVVTMDIDPVAWTKNGQNLLDENKNVIGTYDGTNLNVTIPSPANNTQIQISIKREANHIDYREVWFNPQEKVYIINARLFTSGE
jgi:hypothetical protein